MASTAQQIGEVLQEALTYVKVDNVAIGRSVEDLLEQVKLLTEVALLTDEAIPQRLEVRLRNFLD